MKKIVEEDVSSRQGFVLMPSYLEAALYVHLFSELKFFSEENRKLDDIASKCERYSTDSQFLLIRCALMLALFWQTF